MSLCLDNRNIKIVELFGGIGAIRKAFIDLGIKHEVLDYVEIDNNAVKAYNKLYDADFCPKDICDYHLPKSVQLDILMHGSPCQDFSLIGKKKGGVKGSNTRSSLLYETVRCIDELTLKPKVVIWENVKGVLSKKMKPTFDHYLEVMSELGYVNEFRVLNSIDHGVPQNRNRVFVISVLKEYYDKPFFDDIVKLGARNVAKPIKKYLDKEFDEKYIVRQPSVLTAINGNAKHSSIQSTYFIKDRVNTILTKQMRLPNSGFIELGDNKYRYLTEDECLRFMGFSNDDVSKLREIYPSKKGVTSSILYKLAGNSIVVDVLRDICKVICDNVSVGC